MGVIHEGQTDDARCGLASCPSSLRKAFQNCIKAGLMILKACLSTSTVKHAKQSDINPYGDGREAKVFATMLNSHTAMRQHLQNNDLKSFERIEG